MVSDQGDVIERDAQRLVRAITAGTTNLLEVIESMSGTLNSEMTIVRKEALDTLAEVIRGFPAGFLNESEAASLLEYFNAQLKGHPDHSRPAIVALKALFDHQAVPREAVAVFVERFFNETTLVDLSREDKMNLYQIFNKILTNTSFLESVQKMHSAFLPGFLQLVELETDPQCLMLCFSMYQIVVKHFPLGVYADEMFEYPAAYFPIDFNAPPERHGGVTKGKLQEAVEKCLLSHKSFEENVIKLCLEKMSSQLPEAQIDSLRLLKRAVLQYDAEIAVEYSQAVWPTLRMLHMEHRGDAQYQEAIFKMLTALGQKLSESTEWRDALEKFSHILWTDFEEVESFVDHCGWRFIVAFGGGSVRCAQVILPKAFTKVTTLIAEGQRVSSSLIDAGCSLISVSASVDEGFADETLRKCIEMLAGQSCSRLLDDAYAEHYVKILAMLEKVLHIETAIRDSEKESIRRFIEKSISSSPNVPARTLKKFIAACNAQFSNEFSSELCRLAKECRCVWLLAGLVDTKGQNAEEICFELLTIRDSAALESVQEIVSVHSNLAEAVLDELLRTFHKISDDILPFYDSLLTTTIRSVSPSVISSKLSYLLAKLTPTPMPLVQLRIILSNCPACCLDPQICSEIANKLLELASELYPPSETLSQCLALLANKHPEGSGETWLSKCKVGDALIVGYVAKGLLMRGLDLCQEFVEEAIENVIRQKDGPSSFAVIVKPEPNIFRKEGGCTVRILFPQKLMTISMPKLLKKFETAIEEEKVAISMAICLSLCHVCPDIAEKYTSVLRPVILWSVSHTTLPSCSSLGLLRCVRRNFLQIQLSINAIIPPLIRWIQRPSPMELRIEAISCLEDLIKFFEVYHLLPHKKRVLKSLPIGDRKRLIRRAAAQTSATWYMLGEA